MLKLTTKIEHADKISAQLVLSYASRENSRLRTALSSGEEVAVLTKRGTVLLHNDLLQGDDGRVVQIIAAEEPTYRVTCSTSLNLLRCAFHLGNRHTQTQVTDSFLRIHQDRVLREMLEGLGATVTEENARFEPESGAYAGGGGSGHHDDHDDHGHDHDHGHGGHSHGPLAPIPLRQKIHRPSDRKE